MSEQEKQESPSRFAGEEHHGWSPDVGSGGSERATEANEKAFDTPPAGKGPGREISEEERTGVSDTDMEPDAALGVGVDRTSTHGEDYGREGDAGRSTEGTKDASQRPYGTSDPKSATGVDPQGTTDPESPYIPPGDQGG